MAIIVAGIPMRDNDSPLHVPSKFLLLHIHELLSTSPHLCQSKTPIFHVVLLFGEVTANPHFHGYPWLSYFWNILKRPHPSISLMPEIPADRQ